MAEKRKAGRRERYRAARKRVSDIIEVGYNEDWIGRGYDFLNLAVIIINLIVTVMMTFESLTEAHGALLRTLEGVTVAFFAVDLLLRLWTAGCLYPNDREPIALLRYVFSFNGLVDIFSCIPYYLPFFFPSGAAAFRIFRVLRIFRIFRINAYYDSLHVITAVIRSKAQMLLSSIFILLMLMLASSLCMYSLEHEAQPEVFKDALSGLWWSAATLLTVGYGDIYPVTAAGQIMGIFITMLGVGMVAIPTGIISAGFVEQYSYLKSISESAVENDIRFIRVPLGERDSWTGQHIQELRLPRGIIIAAVQRGRETLVPRGSVELRAGDIIVLGAEEFRDGETLVLKEIELKERHEWNGQQIRELDISRQSFIVTIRRDGRSLIPRGDLRLRAGDTIVLYTKRHLPEARELRV